jgi:aminoglycoside phosphotransferase family enzyme/predicted kinase
MKHREPSIVEFLSRGQAYGLPQSPVETVTTHAATIFLVGDRAYKMKRPVRYSFFDFTELAARKAALEAELRLNRRTAPTLYRRLVPVTDDGHGGLAIDGPGEPVEWLLEMRRFDQDALLDRLAERGDLDPGIVDRLAREIAAFHDHAEVRRDRGGLAGMSEVIQGNREDFSRLVGEVLPEAEIADLNQKTCAELKRRAELLERRREDGRVRHCHGDLHLGNIVLLDGRPVLFDCLEFDEALASTDTFYDLAFLVMDLVHRRLDHLAQRLLTGYLEEAWDDQGPALLPLFLSCRAAIRAKVMGFGAESAEQDEERAAGLEAACDYLERARSFLAPASPQVIAIGGVSGTGKTTLARALAPGVGAAPGAVVLRSDTVRKRLFGKAPEERLGADAYRAEVTQKVYEALGARAATLLRAGHAAIIDAVFLRPDERAAVERVASDTGVPFRGLWLSAPADVLERRIVGRQADASDATVEVLRRQLDIDPGWLAWSTVDASGAPDETIDAARTALAVAPRG